MMNITKIQQMTNTQMISKEGGIAYQLTLKEKIAEFFSLGLLNGTFYQTEKEVLDGARNLLEEALEKEPVFATKSAIYGAEVNSLKLVPTIWLVYVSKLEDKTLFKQAFSRIIRNPKMLHDFMHIARKGGIREGLGRGVKKVVNEWLYNHLNEYQVTRNKGKLSEIVRVTHPNNNAPSFDSYMQYLRKEKLTFPRAIALKNVLSDLNKGVYVESTQKLIEEHKIQLEELKHGIESLSVKDKKSLYMAMYRGLNYTALILNLVALERVFATRTATVEKHGQRGCFLQEQVIETHIPTDFLEVILSKIKDVEGYRRSNMLPFALINAERMVVTPEIKQAINDLFKKVSEMVFQIPASTSLLVNIDTSGSMGDALTDSLKVSDIANLFTALVKKSHSSTRLFAVASNIEQINLRQQENVTDMVNTIRNTKVGHGTYFEQIMDKYDGEKYVLLLTDSESADNLEKRWMRTSKPNGAKLIVWQLSPDYIHLSKDASVVYVCGYSDRLLGLIQNIIEGKTGQIEEIEQISL